MSERLNPGSPEAGAKGCKCPVIDNHHGKGIRDDGKMFVINGLCPMHGTPLPDWHQEWRDTQGFLHNDDDLFHVAESPEPDSCDACAGAGEIRIDWFRDGEKARIKPCKKCGGRGFIDGKE